jgi:hypothetical protein
MLPGSARLFPGTSTLSRQLGEELGQTLRTAFGEARLKEKVLSLDVAEFE